ncbi:TIGR03084 family protein [Variovorax sp. CF313]|uniref:TIGR03084 family metal-binding protein n=1 Tax=Variovorax sp. CF313 TaxID=1144315 RepID=UPI0002713E78|nr:TIGR03084 family metal-binding protein [Variovorax sp. CF313]EJL73754.1 TIGR03084 family protein [Variovorax sp. CF313]
MRATCNDLLAEYQALDSLCATLSAEDWLRQGAFFGWSTWDQIAHLSFLDETALLSVTDPGAFVADARTLNRLLDSGQEISALAREKYGQLDGPALLRVWRSRYELLVASLARLDAKARLNWYGPQMSARSFATARLMETWAHGQDVWDVMARHRVSGHRLKHIAHIGCTTFGWTFANRGMAVPEPAPWVDLQAPDGSRWTWGEMTSDNRVVGSAEDFCLVVTQRRNVRGTALEVQGKGAIQWMALAQCFAGPPSDPPVPRALKVADA